MTTASTSMQVTAGPRWNAGQAFKAQGEFVQFPTLTELNAAIALTPSWHVGQLIYVISEPLMVFRVWDGTDCNTAVFYNGATVEMAGATNTITETSGAPSGGSPVDGDRRWDKTAKMLYTRASGAWDTGRPLAGSELNVDGKKLSLVAGVLRNTGSGWALIEDSGHTNVHVSGVSSDSSSIVVSFGGIPGSKVVSVVAGPDDTLAVAGFCCGSSVTPSQAAIFLKRAGVTAQVADYVSWNGSAFVSQNGVFTIGSYASGILTLTHPNVTVVPPVITIASRSGLLLCFPETVTGTTTSLKWFDYAGTLITAESTNMKVWLNRGLVSGQTDPSTVNTTTFPSSNIWFIGVIEANA
jgi:hypothetical protein